MKSPTQFRLPNGLTRSDIDSALAERYAYLTEMPLVQSWRIYDTFDQRLFAQALMLQWSGDEVLLRAVPQGDTLFNLPWALPPRMAMDLPEGAFRTQLAAIIQRRALLELTAVHTISIPYRILNKDEKTVARLVYTEMHQDAAGEGTPLATYLTVMPLRGYSAQAERLATLIKRSFEIASTKEDIYYLALKSAIDVRGTYSEKLDVHLKPGIPAGNAARLILHQLLEKMRANEEGIKADIDTEFLHDYRIAVRRTRSALSEIRNVFPAEAAAHFAREFKELGRLTNELRDLDVHLLAEADYRAMLRDTMQEDITPLFDTLRAHRSMALDQVVAGLESDGYALLLEEWHHFLHEPFRKNDAGNASVPIIKLAQERITRRYKSIVKMGTSILENTEDEQLHALRIECKKLRYLLEFFASLYPRKELAQIIKQLRRLQDNLGEFSDLAVQEEFLLSNAEALDIDEASARRVLVATGYLVEILERKGQQAKANFAGTFKNFASPAHQKQFRKVIGQKRRFKS